MKTLNLIEFGVSELNSAEMQDQNGGGLKEWLIGKALDAAVAIMEAYAKAYVEFSVETGGQYVIHHAV